MGGGDKKPGKDHRLTFTIGAFNDGLKTNFCNNPFSMLPHIGIKRLLTDRDETVFGINRNQADKLRKFFTHT